LKLLTEGDLLRTQTFFTVYGSPTGGSMAAPKKLLINSFVTRPAVAGSQVRTDHKPVMIDFLLIGTRSMAVEAIHATLCMGGHFVFVDNRILEPRMTLCAFSRGPDKVGSGLCRLNARALPIDKKCRHNQRKCNHDSEKD
jgi:hypothetical protein